MSLLKRTNPYWIPPRLVVKGAALSQMITSFVAMLWAAFIYITGERDNGHIIIDEDFVDDEVEGKIKGIDIYQTTVPEVLVFCLIVLHGLVTVFNARLYKAVNTKNLQNLYRSWITLCCVGLMNFVGRVAAHCGNEQAIQFEEAMFSNSTFLAHLYTTWAVFRVIEEVKGLDGRRRSDKCFVNKKRVHKGARKRYKFGAIIFVGVIFSNNFLESYLFH
ncbi:uncharacterized protein LOC110857735 [Folsomia candida]|uniref:Uncharacterized protein n=1 Tax=Folsomia candida TaxID=158441 RepID=A0A226DGE0_FOLCA|nr:uncharacterized protein LOC110857735 [Folsomia candida]OXA44635.1 hypothetical protein Fcan01_20849 [Folsomia candida]